MVAAIRAVVFDVGGVLTDPLGPVFVAAAAEAGIDLDALRSGMATSLSGGDDDDPFHRLERGEIALAEFLALSGDAGPARLLFDPGSSFFPLARLRHHTGMGAFVREVRERGLATALLSNAVAEWEAVWATFVPADLPFDVSVMSYRVGMRKPEARIYQHVLAALGVEPAEAVFLDDFPAMVDGARAVGMQAVLVDDHDRAIAEARALLDAPGA